MISCRYLAELLLRFVDRELPAEHCELIQSHLAGCLNCAAYADSYRQIIRLARWLPPAPLPAELVRGLHRAIERQRAGQA